MKKWRFLLYIILVSVSLYGTAIGLSCGDGYCGADEDTQNCAYDCCGGLSPENCSLDSNCYLDNGLCVPAFCAGCLDTCCPRGCVDLLTDIYNCGECNNRCSFNEACVNGVCVILNATAGAFCGDGSCDADEDTLSCPGDCCAVYENKTECSSQLNCIWNPELVICVPSGSEIVRNTTVLPEIAPSSSTTLSICGNGICEDGETPETCGDCCYLIPLQEECDAIKGCGWNYARNECTIEQCRYCEVWEECCYETQMCVDINSDPANCGRCGNRCGFNESCVKGICVSGGAEKLSEPMILEFNVPPKVIKYAHLRISLEVSVPGEIASVYFIFRNIEDNKVVRCIKWGRDYNDGNRRFENKMRIFGIECENNIERIDFVGGRQGFGAEIPAMKLPQSCSVEAVVFYGDNNILRSEKKQFRVFGKLSADEYKKYFGRGFSRDVVFQGINYDGLEINVTPPGDEDVLEIYLKTGAIRDSFNISIYGHNVQIIFQDYLITHLIEEEDNNDVFIKRIRTTDKGLEIYSTYNTLIYYRDKLSYIIYIGFPDKKGITNVSVEQPDLQLHKILEVDIRNNLREEEKVFGIRLLKLEDSFLGNGFFRFFLKKIGGRKDSRNYEALKGYIKNRFLFNGTEIVPGFMGDIYDRLMTKKMLNHSICVDDGICEDIELINRCKDCISVFWENIDCNKIGMCLLVNDSDDLGYGEITDSWVFTKGDSGENIDIKTVYVGISRNSIFFLIDTVLSEENRLYVSFSGRDGYEISHVEVYIENMTLKTQWVRGDRDRILDGGHVYLTDKGLLLEVSFDFLNYTAFGGFIGVYFENIGVDSKGIVISDVAPGLRGNETGSFVIPPYKDERIPDSLEKYYYYMPLYLHLIRRVNIFLLREYLNRLDVKEFISRFSKIEICGDGVCSGSENCETCAVDCLCLNNTYCVNGSCVAPVCGNRICEPYESPSSCCDCCGENEICQNNSCIPEEETISGLCKYLCENSENYYLCLKSCSLCPQCVGNDTPEKCVVSCLSQHNIMEFGRICEIGCEGLTFSEICEDKCNQCFSCIFRENTAECIANCTQQEVIGLKTLCENVCSEISAEGGLCRRNCFMGCYSCRDISCVKQCVMEMGNSFLRICRETCSDNEIEQRFCGVYCRDCQGCIINGKPNKECISDCLNARVAKRKLRSLRFRLNKLKNIHLIMDGSEAIGLRNMMREAKRLIEVGKWKDAKRLIEKEIPELINKLSAKANKIKIKRKIRGIKPLIAKRERVYKYINKTIESIINKTKIRVEEARIIDEGISVSVDAEIVTVEEENQTKNATVIKFGVENTKNETLYNISVIYVIPKNVAENASLLVFDDDVEVIEEDPVIAWSIDELEPQFKKELKYSVKKEIDVDDIKESQVSVIQIDVESDIVDIDDNINNEDIEKITKEEKTKIASSNTLKYVEVSKGAGELEAEEGSVEQLQKGDNTDTSTEKESLEKDDVSTTGPGRSASTETWITKQKIDIIKVVPFLMLLLLVLTLGVFSIKKR